MTRHRLDSFADLETWLAGRPGAILRVSAMRSTRSFITSIEPPEGASVGAVDATLVGSVSAAMVRYDAERKE